MIYDVEDIKDDFEKVLEIIYNRPVDITRTFGLDTTTILKDMIVNRLDIEDFNLNQPTVVNIKGANPKFNIIVNKLKIEGTIKLLGVEFMEM